MIWFRVLKGHFNKEHHFGFEAVAWYWHFVDVVWLGLVHVRLHSLSLTTFASTTEPADGGLCR